MPWLLASCLVILLGAELTRRRAQHLETSMFRESVEHYFEDDLAIRLCEAIEAGDMKSCRMLLDKKPSLASYQGRFGLTPLYWANQNRELKCFKFLLEKGAQATNSMGRVYSVVHSAVRMDEEDYLEALIENDVDIDVGNGSLGRTPLAEAAICGNLFVINSLLEFCV